MTLEVDTVVTERPERFLYTKAISPLTEKNARLANPGRYVASRTAALRERLTFVADRAGRGELDGVEIEDGKLFIARTPPAVPDVVELRCSWAFVSGHELGVFERAALTEPPGPARPPARKYCPSNDEIVPSSQIAG
jgi:hypothetical protein